MNRAVAVLLVLALLRGGVAAPVPGAKAPKELAEETFRKLLGKNHLDDAMDTFREAIKARPDVAYHGASFHHSWKDIGLELSFDDESRLAAVFLYAGRCGEPKRYAGGMPASLTFDDTPAKVRKKLGEPETVSKTTKDSADPKKFSFTWEFPKKGLTMNLILEKEGDDPDEAKIGHIGIYDKDTKRH